MAKSNSINDFEINGVPDLISFLGNFAPKIETKMLDQSVSAAVRQGFATPIKKNIRQALKKGTGNLLKGVKVKKIKGAPPGSYRVFMGPPAFHSHFFEYGTVGKRPAVGKLTKYKAKRRGVTLTSKTHRPIKSASGFGGGSDQFRMVKHTGGVAAKPFFRPGVFDNKRKAADKLRIQLKKRIDKEVAKQKKA